MNKEDENIENKKEEKEEKEDINHNNKTFDKDEGNDGNILDKLFFKTKTKPYIYYLPLTKEQVKQKLEKKKSYY